NIFAKFSSHLSQGNVVEIFGTISLREDEEAKIIADEIRTVDKNAVPKPEPKPSRPQDNNEPVRLYLRIDNRESELYRRSRQVTDIFDGRTPVVYYLPDTKKSFIAPDSMWVSLNDVMINELKRRLGNENVAVK
ncbi:MAG: DNA polymerase III subunit alpha, partial [Ruminococcus sp.]|nr:DNA polymerase III subunit alpha [Ruminococcus sp.]